MPREPRPCNASFEGADQQRHLVVRIEVGPSGIVERLAGQVSVKLVIRPQLSHGRRPDRGRLVMPQHDSTRPYGFRQPTAFAGNGRNAAELRFGDDATPSLIFPLARHQQYARLPIHRLHVGRSIMQRDVSETANAPLQIGQFLQPQRPAAHKAKGNFRAQRRDFKRQVHALDGNRVDEGDHAAGTLRGVMLAAKERG